MDWREELYQILIGHFSEAPFDEAVRELADLGAHYPAVHESHLAAMQGAYEAGVSGDQSVVDVINKGNARYVPDIPAAVAFLERLRESYLSQYEREATSRRTAK